MRYGVVRVSQRLPSPEDQRRLIESVGCDVILEERSASFAGQRIVLQLLYRLKAGDEVLVHSLEAFEASVGELARLLCGFHDGDVTLRIVGGARVETLSPVQPAPRALTLLADFELRHPTRAATRRRVRAEAKVLTPHQLRFAWDLHRRGYSMRAIGLLFQLSPNEVADLLRGYVGRSATHGADRSGEVDPSAPAD